MKDKENSIVNKGTNNNILNNNNSNLINPTHPTEITNTIYNTYNGINTTSNYNFEIEENNQLQTDNDNHNNDNDNNNSTNNNNNNFTSNDNTINNKQLNKNTIKLFQNNSNIPNTELINNIAYLNECFISKNNDNDIINSKWKQLQITNLISNDKLYSENKDEIMFRGYLNKLVISHMFKNCSTSVEKFIILKRDQVNLYKNKENFLLNYKPQHTFHLKEIINCKRINFSFLNIQKLEGFYFMYIELFRQAKSNEQQEDLIFNIIKREKEGKFFVLFSQKEQIINEWIYIINYFKENYLINENNHN